MKRLWLLAISAMLLAACSNDAKEEVPEKTVVTEKETEPEKKEEPVKEAEPVSEDDGTLSKVGQVIEDDGVTVELMAIKEVNDTIDMNPVKVTVKDIKIIRMSNITDQDLLFNVSQYTDKSEFDYIQINYEIENTEDSSVRLNSPINTVVLNTGEQISSHEMDFNRDPNFAKTLYGKVKNESYVSLIMKQSDPADINEIKVVIGRIDADSGETLAEEKIVTYKLN